MHLHAQVYLLNFIRPALHYPKRKPYFHIA